MRSSINPPGPINWTGHKVLSLYYSRAAKQTVYNRLLIKAASVLADHSAVVIDATYSEHAQRDQLKKATERQGQLVFWIEMTADEETIRARVSQSREDSEADYKIY